MRARPCDLDPLAPHFNIVKVGFTGVDIFPGEGACGSVVYRCVNKQTMRKGTFFELDSAQRCHHLVSETCYFCRRRVCVSFTCLLKHCDKVCLVVTELREKCSIFPMYIDSVQYTKNAEVCVLIDNIGKGSFLTGHSEKGYHFQNVDRTV